MDSLNIKDNFKFFIRPAERKDATFLGAVVIGALGDKLCSQLAGSRDYRSILEDLFGSLSAIEKSQYSYLNSFIAETANGTKIGGIIAYDGAQMHSLRKAFLQKATELLGWNKTEEELTDETNPGEIYIDSLFVEPRCRRHGVAEKLILSVIEKYKDCGKPIGLLAEPHNHKALNLYEKVGFKIIETGDFFGEKMPHLQYSKHLSLY